MADKKKNTFTGFIVTTIIIAIVSFFLCVLVFNYIKATKQYSDAMSSYNMGETTEQPSKADALAFKLSYFYTLPEEQDKTLALGMLALFIGGFFAYKIQKSNERRNANKEIEGNDRWATTKEIKKNFYEVDEHHLDKAEKTGMVVAHRNGKYYIDPTTTHSFIVGTTRSGKTQTFVLPMIRLMSTGKDKQHFIINDPKGELLENTYELLKENGYNIVVLNLRETDKSSLWNPLTFIIQKYKQAMDNHLDLSKVNEYIDVMVEVLTQNDKSDPIWPSSAKSLMTAMILYLMELGYKNNTLDKVNLYSVYQFFIEYGVTEQEIINGVQVETTKLDKLFQALPTGNPAKAAYATSNFASGDMKSSIFATLSENMSLFGRDAGIATLTSGSDIDFIRLFGDEQKPTAVFMIIPDNRPARHSVASMFINQAYLALCEYLEDNGIKKLPRTVNFILDEFANMVTIPNMESKITVAASRGIIFHLFVQSLQQMESKYSRNAKVIQENCGNTVYIYSLSPETNEYFSKMLGNSTLEYASYSGTIEDGIKNKSYQYKAKPLKTPTELSVLEYGETIIKHQRMYPILTRFDFFYKLGIKVTPIADIPLASNNQKLIDCLFPFEIINNHLEIIKNGGNPEQLGAINPNEVSDVPDIPMVSPDTHARRTAEQKNSYAKISPIKRAIEVVDKQTNGEFTKLLEEQDFRQLKILLNQLNIKRTVNVRYIEVLMEYVKNKGVNNDVETKEYE